MRSSNKKIAPEGVLAENVRYDEGDSRVFRRLGIDLVDVTDDGDAIVHIEPGRLEQLISTTGTLADVGTREQARWASVASFDLVPIQLRLDDGWIKTLKPQVLADAVVKFQPLLSRVETDTLLRSIMALLKRERREAITGIGMDFSGRHWARGKITPE